MEEKMKIAVQFGAGNIGRGFMGQLFFESGYKTVFVEARRDLVDMLNKRGSYPLRILDAYAKEEFTLEIRNIEAIAAHEQELIGGTIAKADVLCTAVGVKNLSAVAPLIGAGIERRREQNAVPINVLLCENILDAAQRLQTAVHEMLDADARKWAIEHIGFVGTTVARMVPGSGDRFKSDDPLQVVADSYHRLAYDGKAMKGTPPEIEGLYPVRNFKAEVERKLFIYNLGHAALAYLGYLKGFSYVHETIRDEKSNAVFEGALDETSAALLKLYPEDLDPAEHDEVRKDVRVRFGNPMIMDSVQRVGRDPIRKLGPQDRLIGSASLCLSQNIFPGNIARVCAAALHYTEPRDPDALRLQEMIKKHGVENTLKSVSGVSPESEFGKAVLKYYHEFLDQ
jgi:mannitol-1-phosphate 5-dehydrogenase